MGAKHVGGWVLLWVMLWGGGLQAQRIELLEGLVLEATVESIDTHGNVQLKGSSKADVGWADIRRIETGVATGEQNASGTVVYLRGGGQVFVKSVAMDGRVCVMETELLGRVELAMQWVRGVWLHGTGEGAGAGQPSDEFRAMMQEAGGQEADRLWVKSGQGLQQVAGTLETLTEEGVKFVWNQQTRSVGRERVVGVILAGTGQREIGTHGEGEARVGLSDGSVLTGRLRELKEGRLHWWMGEATVNVLWGKVVKLETGSGRLVYVSDLEPVKVLEVFFPTDGWRWQRDRAVTGQLMQVDGKVYERGIGVHAKSVLEYELGGGYEWLLATIGLQPTGNRQGDCEFVVRGDGVELFRQRMRRGDQGQMVKLSIRGVKRLVLAVEPGENFDIGDHANWADVRLVKGR